MGDPVRKPGTGRLVVSPVPPEAPATGAELIAAERARQVAGEGWTPEHDDAHDAGELCGAGAAYAVLAHRQIGSGLHEAHAVQPPGQTWRWESQRWKPSADPLRNLVKAGALVAAEIDRLLRAAADPAAQELPAAATSPPPRCWSGSEGRGP